MPPQRGSRTRAGKQVEALRHEQDSRTNIPTAEYQSLVSDDQESPLRKAYERRNRDLDPQLVWRGKDEQDLDDLVVNVPPLYIQEKVQPKALIDDLVRQSRNGREPRAIRSTCSPTSTACPRAPTAPSSTSTTATGRTA